MRKRLAALWLIIMSTIAPFCATVTRAQDAGAFMLEADTGLSNEGYFVLSWDIGVDQDIVTNNQLFIQQSTMPGFDDARDIRINTAGSMTITGLDSGDYYYRAGYKGANGGGDETWSDTVQVTVQHHDLGRAGFFFFTGLTLFLILTVTILRGNRHVETAGD